MNAKQKIFLLIFCALAIGTGFYLYSPFPLYFLNDDFIHIPLSKTGVLFQRKSFRPICDLSIGLDYLFWKKEAIGYHITNLVLHIADTVLVYVLSNLINKKFTSGSPKWISLLSATLFFVYPFHSETIYWILGRSGSLGALFFLPATIYYLKRNEKAIFLALSLFFFIIGLITYESVWAFPIVAVFISWLEKGNERTTYKKEIRNIAAIIVVFIAMLAFRHAAIGEIAGNYEAAGFKTLDIKTLFLNCGRLMIRSFTPPVDSISMFYWCGFITGVLLCLVIYSNRKSKNSQRLTGFLLLAFAATLLPCLSLGINIHSSEGERFLYLPSAFVCILVVNFIFRTIKNRNAGICLFALIILYSTYFLLQSNRNYATASLITKITIKEVNKLEGKSRLQVINLPKECNGALIFRLGLTEALNWMQTPPSITTVSVSSVLPNIREARKGYSVVIKDISMSDAEYPIASDSTNQQSQALFIYTDTSLVVRK